MRRLVLSAIVVVGTVAAARPTFANPIAVTVPDYAQAAAEVTNQPAQPVAWSPSSDATTAPVGFGWG
jgi:hypothetical protein